MNNYYSHSSSLSSIEEDEVTNSRSPSRRKRNNIIRKFHSAPFIPLSGVGETNKFVTSGFGENISLRDDMRVASHWQELNNETEHDDISSSISNPETDNKVQRCDEIGVVGENYKARFPWQRDVSTQCNVYACHHSPSTSRCENKMYCTRVNESSTDHLDSHRGSSGNVRRRKSRVKNKRPKSFGCLNLEMSDEENSQYLKHYSNEKTYGLGRSQNASDPCLLQRTTRMRMPLLLADDLSSLPDIEAIMELQKNEIYNKNHNNNLDSEICSTELDYNREKLDVHRNGLLESTTSLSENDVSLILRFLCSSDEKDLDVLPSPRVSPEMWKNIPDVVVNSEKGYDNTDSTDCLHTLSPPRGRSTHLLSVPRKPLRRLSSAGFNSGSEESDQDISPPVARRGRRAAIVDTKNFGDVSPTQLSPHVSPSNSCDEGEGGSNIAGRLRRQQSSHDVAMNVYPGDLLVQEQHKKLIKRNTISDFNAGRTVNECSTSLNEESKKHRQPFSLLKLMKTRGKESRHLTDVLKELKPSEFKDNHLAAYKNVHWKDLIASTDKQSSLSDSLNLSEGERKRRESVWELFKSECVFLIDHLMVLKHCFLEPLKKVQVEGFLMFTEPSAIFSNLDELCYVSYTFCKDFIYALLKDMSTNNFGSTLVLIKAFQRFSSHSKDGSVYHTYCLSYTNALSYLETLRKNDDFCEFEKLADLLIGPMQHCTKLPLLLQNIQKYTEDSTEKIQIKESLERVENSLRHLEDKMKWLNKFERVQEIQRHLVWPSVNDIDSRVFIPDYLKAKLSRQPCERLLACPSRQLLFEGAISLTESVKSSDAYMFLFDDILLITKVKKSTRKQKYLSMEPTGQADNQLYTVHRQPIALDRIGIHDVPQNEAAANGLKFAFVVVQISRFQQIIDVFTLQASTEQLKTTWMSQIIDAKNNHLSQSHGRCNSLNANDCMVSLKNIDVKKRRNGKSQSTDYLCDTRSQRHCEILTNTPKVVWNNKSIQDER